MRTFLPHFLILLALIFTSCTRTTVPIDDQIIGKINGQEITAREFIFSFSRLISEQDDATRKNKKLTEQLKLRAFNEALITVILRQEAAKRNVRVAREEVESRLSSWKDGYPPGGFEEMLARHRTTEEMLRKRIEDQLLVEKLTDSVFAEESLVSDEELKRSFSENQKDFVKPERIHAFQIVVPTREEADKIRAEISSAKISFESAARRQSLSPDAAKGGDLGFFSRGEKIAAFDQAFQLSVGALSKPIESRYGWHLFKVVEKEPSRKLSFNEAKNEILKSIRRAKQARAYKDWVAKLLKDAEIYRNETLFASIS